MNFELFVCRGLTEAVQYGVTNKHIILESIVHRNTKEE
jgi:hypothetical protein